MASAKSILLLLGLYSSCQTSCISIVVSIVVGYTCSYELVIESIFNICIQVHLLSITDVGDMTTMQA